MTFYYVSEPAKRLPLSPSQLGSGRYFYTEKAALNAAKKASKRLKKTLVVCNTMNDAEAIVTYYVKQYWEPEPLSQRF